MAHIGSKWRLDRPVTGFLDAVPSPPAPMYRFHEPDCYEPRYPYPLLVLFHPQGSNEEQVIDLVPKMSERNFVAVSIRGPELLGVREDGQLACGWGQDNDHADVVTEFVWKAVEEARRSYHIHTERVFLVGVCEGASAAYRTAFQLADRVAGVAVLNGSVPKATAGCPVFRWNAVRGMKVMIGHGIANAVVPCSTAHRDYRMLYAAGADVRLNTYATTHRLHQHMLRDVNRWVIGNLNAEYDQLAITG